MDDDLPPLDPAAQRGLTLLRWLVMTLTATMIVGLIAMIWLFVTRLPNARTVPLPDGIALPSGAVATAFTRGPDWLAVVTEDGEILIFAADGTTLRQRIQIEPAGN